MAEESVTLWNKNIKIVSQTHLKFIDLQKVYETLQFTNINHTLIRAI